MGDGNAWARWSRAAGPSDGRAAAPARDRAGTPVRRGAAGGGGDGVTRVLGTITLPGVRPSVGSVRRFLRDLLPEDHPLRDDLVAVGSETVSNAITHTASGREGGEVTVVLAAERGRYRLEVADDGAGGIRPHVKADSLAENGRGMRIVEALASRWGYREDGERTVVWVEFEREAAPGR
ncbi:ATP-binding protein [Actinomadura kijaniata]|uniref:ATP-binding protein n=1 Tax=Actinomadura kijaniata TaxID=46161 RepID=UPI00157CAB60|nr:ATP-binding protein [Actinomadura kijaniata]